jgi:hypothetical protein
MDIKVCSCLKLSKCSYLSFIKNKKKKKKKN